MFPHTIQKSSVLWYTFLFTFLPVSLEDKTSLCDWSLALPADKNHCVLIPCLKEKENYNLSLEGAENVKHTLVLCLPPIPEASPSTDILNKPGLALLPALRGRLYGRRRTLRGQKNRTEAEGERELPVCDTGTAGGSCHGEKGTAQVSWGTRCWETLQQSQREYRSKWI